jgi:hypothetical protein
MNGGRGSREVIGLRSFPAQIQGKNRENYGNSSADVQFGPILQAFYGQNLSHFCFNQQGVLLRIREGTLE